MSLPKEFYITLASDESSEYFDTSSKNPSFTNKLPSALLFKEPYSVALTEIYIPPFSIKSSTNSNDIIRQRRQTESLGDGLSVLSTQDNPSAEQDNPPADQGKPAEPEKEKNPLDVVIDGGRNINITLDEMNTIILFKISEYSPNTGGFWYLKELFPLFFSKIDPNILNDAITLAKIKVKLREIMDTLSVQKIGYTSQKSSDYPFFYLSVPYNINVNNNYLYHLIQMPIKSYDSLKSFFQEIVERIPPQIRSPQLLFYIYLDIASGKDFKIPILKKIKNIFMNVATDDFQIQEEDVQAIDKNILSSFLSVSELRMLFIYSDIVASQIYANRMLNLLRVIPYFNRDVMRDGLHVTFDTPEFYPMSKEYFESVSIIVSSREDEIRFNIYNKNPIYVKLLFRRT